MQPKTKEQLVDELGLRERGSVDFALPQLWLDAYAKDGFDYEELRLGFVWVYFDGDAFGKPYPITPEAMNIVGRVMLIHATACIKGDE